MPKPYPQEFRDDVVAVARQGQAPLKQIAKDFGISEGCLHGWMKRDDVEDGHRPGVTDAQAVQVREPGVAVVLGPADLLHPLQEAGPEP